ncbi:MAG: 4-hydroxy-tetrahydrodipicolinate reductase, partial [Eubacteriales bacterium]|nr:4-hydroxy-tetrahydrodipicolinate reductase [Eubacteriales bacterium]
MTKVLLSGCGGSMGTVITNMASETKEVRIVCGFDIRAGVKRDYPVYQRLKDCKEKPDVIIDFSN